jgi:addiction module RelE/StbE family toxin
LLKKAIEEIENEKDDPTRLGTRKRGSYSDAYSYEIGSSIRLIYRVDFRNRIIEFVAVGSHKDVYGRD